MSNKTTGNLVGKAALVTGASRGIGAAIAKRLAADGASVAITYSKGAEAAASVVKAIEAAGGKALAIQADAVDAKAVKAAVEKTVATFGRLDVLVNNAGYANVSSIEDVAEDDFRAQIETNLFGVVNLTRAALPVMHRQRQGHIIQISSIGGRAATPGIGAYQTAKWAIGGFSEVLAREVAPLGIKVTVVEPGGMKTDWAGSSMRVDDISPDYQATVGQISAMRRSGGPTGRGDPAKIAQAILHIVAETSPPLRLLLGTDAVLLAKAASAARAKQDAAWEALSSSTDFDGEPPFGETDYGKALAAAIQ
jgi:NAD(P)-dependent dehydrogenase (short-subunit alcohol dehydrogenase family)